MEGWTRRECPDDQKQTSTRPFHPHGSPSISYTTVFTMRTDCRWGSIQSGGYQLLWRMITAAGLSLDKADYTPLFQRHG